MTKKRILTFIVVGALTSGATLFAANQVSAQTDSSTHPNIVTAFAQKFGLDVSQVQAFFVQYRQQRKGEMGQNMQNRLFDRLSNLVSQGKLTNDQKTAILNEIESLKSKYNLANLNTMSSSDRKKALQGFSSDFKSWAQSQGINFTFRFPFFGHRFGKL